MIDQKKHFMWALLPRTSFLRFYITKSSNCQLFIFISFIAGGIIYCYCQNFVSFLQGTSAGSVLVGSISYGKISFGVNNEGKNPEKNPVSYSISYIVPPAQVIYPLIFLNTSHPYLILSFFGYELFFLIILST